MLRWLRRSWLAHKLRIAKSGWEKRAQVIRLAATGDPLAAEHLVPLLIDPEVGDSAAKGLGGLRNPAVAANLIPLLSHASWSFRHSAACSLEALGWTPPDDKTRVLWQLAAGKYGEVAKANTEAFHDVRDEMRRLAESQNFHHAYSLVTALGEARAVDAIPMLVESLVQYGRAEETHGFAKKCAETLSKIEPKWISTTAAIEGIQETIRRLEREVHEHLGSSYDRRPIFRSTALVLKLFPEKHPVFQAWLEVASGCGGLSSELSAGGRALLRPLLVALHQYPHCTVIDVLDSTISGWWKEPVVRQVADRWVKGLEGKERCLYATLLGLARDSRGIQPLIETIRTEPKHAVSCVADLENIVTRYRTELSTSCLQSICDLDDECQEYYRELVGWSVPYGRGVELPDYDEGTRALDCRPVKKLAMDELARRANNAGP